MPCSAEVPQLSAASAVSFAKSASAAERSPSACLASSVALSAKHGEAKCVGSRVASWRDTNFDFSNKHTGTLMVRLYFLRIFASGTLIRKRYAYFFCNFLVVWYSYYNPVRLLGFFSWECETGHFRTGNAVRC